MDSVLARLGIMVAAGAALYFIARSTSHPSTPLDPPDWPPQPEPPQKGLVLTGSEIPFPFDVREFDPQFPGFKRPNILNYYFRETDLVKGPPDPNSFFDEFFIQFENPKTGDRWTESYFVASPDGMKAKMKEEGRKFVVCTQTIVVKQYELASILRGVLQLFAENDAIFKESGAASE